MSCASSGSLEGGPRDVDPPKLLEDKSSTNFQTLFSERSFTLIFDEFIVLKDPIKQIVVSPPLTYIPTTKVRGKTLFFSFNEKEVIRDSTTYTVNFGEAIQDLHENNKLLNFRFVFSTGTIIDSLAIKGQVLDGSQQNKPATNATVLLYDNLSDSAYVKEKPFYFARTDKEGFFKIENIKSDTFRIFAIIDDNVSYTFNEGAEALAFQDELLGPSSLDTTQLISLTLTKPLPPLKVFDVNAKRYGKVSLKFNRKPEPEFPISVNEPVEIQPSFSGDSLNIWYKTTLQVKDSFFVILPFDTVKIVVPDSSLLPEYPKASLVSTNNILYGFDSLRLVFNNPVANVLGSLVSILDTSAMPLAFESLFMDSLLMKIPSNQFSPGKYELRIDTATYEDFYGRINKDSLRLKFQIADEEKTSGLKLQLTGIDSSRQYLITILENNKELSRFIINDASEKSWTFSNLRPGDYSVSIIEDTNRNGIWDPANFWLRQQPEKIKMFTLEKLRENWTIEADINYSE